MDPFIEAHRNEILAMAEQNGLRNVRVFGSMARGDADETSDVDLLVTLAPETSGLAIVGLRMDLEEALGRKFDVLTEGCLPDSFREEALRQAIAL